MRDLNKITKNYEYPKSHYMADYTDHPIYHLWRVYDPDQAAGYGGKWDNPDEYCAEYGDEDQDAIG